MRVYTVCVSTTDFVEQTHIKQNLDKKKKLAMFEIFLLVYLADKGFSLVWPRLIGHITKTRLFKYLKIL